MKTRIWLLLLFVALMARGPVLADCVQIHVDLQIARCDLRVHIDIPGGRR